MRVLSTHGSPGEVKAMVGLAVQLETVAAVAKGFDALVAGTKILAGGWL